jgi:hypothetical protein
LDREISKLGKDSLQTIFTKFFLINQESPKIRKFLKKPNKFLFLQFSNTVKNKN